MSEDVKILKDDEDVEGEPLESLDDVLSADGFEYRTIRAWAGRPLRVGSLSAGQMIIWLEENQKGDKKLNGMRLIAMSMVKKDNTRMVDADNPEELKKALETLKKKDTKTNGDIVEKLLLLNGMRRKDAEALAKNVSSEVPSGASPTN